jgi:hypothetical protein
LREPVVHFAGLALALFVVAEVVGRTRGEVIDVDPLEIEGRIRQLERSRGTTLTDEERALAERAYIADLILAREARKRGLDDDPRIRSILSQKMLQVLSMGMIQPSEPALREYYEDHEARYTRPPSVTVDQLMRPQAGVEGSAPARPGGDPSRQPAEPTMGSDPETLAQEGLFEHTVLHEVTLNELSFAFGTETADRIFHGERGVWVGPHRTEGGELWFRLGEGFEARPPPPFEAMLGQVRFDWMGEREESFLQERIDELRQRYRIRLIGDERER